MFINRNKIGIWVLLFSIMTAISVHGETDLDAIKKNVRQVLLKTNYMGEYTVTNFRFGRRQEEMYHIWVKDGVLTRQTIAPVWQRGELVITTDNSYVYFIPIQNAGLKLTTAKLGNPLQDLGITLTKFTFKREGVSLLNRNTFLLVGEDNKAQYKLWVSKSDYFPLKMEIYRRDLLFRAFKFYELDKLPTDFNSSNLIPNQATWYHDENTFWRTISIPRLQPGISFRILQPVYLPEGFLLKRATLEELSVASVIHLVYESPDHRIISLFEREKFSDQQRFNPDNWRKLPSVHGRSIYAYQWFKDQVHLALIGPVSQEELKKIAISVE